MKAPLLAFVILAASVFPALPAQAEISSTASPSNGTYGWEMNMELTFTIERSSVLDEDKEGTVNVWIPGETRTAPADQAYSFTGLSTGSESFVFTWTPSVLGQFTANFVDNPTSGPSVDKTRQYTIVDQDADGDGMMDYEHEYTYFGNLDQDDTTDYDLDGLLDKDELLTYGSDPTLMDTDSDGLSDPDEVNVHGTDPALADTDSDGLPDGEELLFHLTDPLVADMDGDGRVDGDELGVMETDPFSPDDVLHAGAVDPSAFSDFTSGVGIYGDYLAVISGSGSGARIDLKKWTGASWGHVYHSTAPSGGTVSLHQDILAVGDPTFDDWRGRVMISRFTDSGVSAEDTLTGANDKHPTGGGYTAMGYSVAMSNTQLFTQGGTLEDQTILVFEEDGGQWSQVQEIMGPQGNESIVAHGRVLDYAHGVLVARAHHGANYGYHVYEQSGGLWQEVAVIESTGAYHAVGNGFIVIGGGSQIEVYEKEQGTWTLAETLPFSTGFDSMYDEIEQRVAASDSRFSFIVEGENCYTPTSTGGCYHEVDGGVAYLYEKDGDDWTLLARKADNGAGSGLDTAVVLNEKHWGLDKTSPNRIDTYLLPVGITTNPGVFSTQGQPLVANWGGWQADPGASGVASTNYLFIENGASSTGQITLSMASQMTGPTTIPLDGNIRFCTGTGSTPDAGLSCGPVDSDGVVQVNVPPQGHVWIGYELVSMPSVLPDGQYTAPFTVTDTS